MKKSLTALCFIAVMAFASMAMATTWSASADPNFTFSTSGDTYSTTLVLGGFNAGYDKVIGGLLTLDFKGSGSISSVKLDTKSQNILFNTVLFGSDMYFFVDGSKLNDGMLDVSVSGKDNKWLCGDLFLDNICLIAEGCQTPVPEPGTMMLLGIGMLGLAVFGKRRMNKEA